MTDATPAPAAGDAAAICARHGVALNEVFASHYGLVARVRGSDGRDLLLKAAQPDQHDCLDEAEAWRAWNGRSCVPRLERTFDDGYHLREFVQGTALSELPGHGRSHARDAGALLAELHAGVADDARAGAPRHWLDTEAQKLHGSAFLDDAARRHAARLVAAIEAAPDRVLVHGDFYSRNILQTQRGLIALDPLARLDVAAADFASFALTCEAGLHALLADLVAGYGAEPPMLDAYVLFWAIRNRHYRGVFEASLVSDPSLTWQPCYIADGDGVTWTA